MKVMLVVERLVATTALVAAAHFAMGYINPSAGGSGGALIFPFASNATSRWAFGSLEGGPLVLLIPLMIGLAAVAVLAFFLGILATFGLWVPSNLWRPLVLVGVACSTALLFTHPSVWIALPLALNAGLAWVAWTSPWTPGAA
jgi:hypothetical protein